MTSLSREISGIRVNRHARNDHENNQWKLGFSKPFQVNTAQAHSPILHAAWQGSYHYWAYTDLTPRLHGVTPPSLKSSRCQSWTQKQVHLCQQLKNQSSNMTPTTAQLEPWNKTCTASPPHWDLHQPGSMVLRCCAQRRIQLLQPHNWCAGCYLSGPPVQDVNL